MFTLMAGSAVAAERLTSGIGWGLGLEPGLALVEAWLGIALAHWTDWPTSFWITTRSAVVYLAAAGERRLVR